MFRVHARLFRVQEAILRSARQQIRAAKQSVIAQAAGSSALFTFLLTLIVGIFKIEWLSTPVIAIILVGVVAILIHVLEIFNLKRDEGEFDRLLGEVGEGNVETWTDYSESVIAAYGTRLKMIRDAIDEAEALHKSKHLTDDAFQRRISYLNDIRQFSLDELNDQQQANEKLYASRKRSKEDFESVNRFLDVARKNA
ncbi:MAG TPA: hypothetical protein VJA94_21225 [Candidatus Angelobacter sp.]